MSGPQREWDAAEYHRLSSPQFSWGLRVLERLELSGSECVIDAGCGSGRLTAELARRLPSGRVVAVDLSLDMTRAAHASLVRGAHAVDVVCADLIALPLPPVADIVFSTATFHWVRDHDALFAELRRVLRAEGRLEAQCGGGANLARTKRVIRDIAERDPYAAELRGFVPAWNYASADETAARLRSAGFTRIDTWLEDAPTVFDSADRYRDFMRTVVLRPWLACMAGDKTRRRFVDAVTDAALRADPPLTLDYVRLNIRARRA